MFNSLRTFTKDDMMTKNYFGDVGDIVEEAYQTVCNWNIKMYAAGIEEGNALDADGAMTSILTEIMFGDAERIVIDNLQGWARSDESDYDAMRRIVPRVSSLTAMYKKLVVALSQYNANGTVRGGGEFSGRANTVLGVKYDGEQTPEYFEVKLTHGRGLGAFTEQIRIDPRSGLIIDGYEGNV
jgi:hypothetical protein